MSVPRCRIREHRTEWVDVKTGAEIDNLVEVFGDLKEADAVGCRGTDQLGPGTEISTKFPELADSEKRDSRWRPFAPLAC